jgi:hypothetical protein
MDDTRNTDNAWMESVSVHFHASDALAQKLVLRAGTDFGVTDVRWVDVNDVLNGKVPLYANHSDLARMTVDAASRISDPSKKDVGANPSIRVDPLSLGVVAALLLEVGIQFVPGNLVAWISMLSIGSILISITATLITRPRLRHLLATPFSRRINAAA